MKVAVLHYHLRRGGVTRVIQHAWAALEPLGVELCVLCGQQPEQTDGFPPLGVLPELAYNSGETPLHPADFAAALKAAARELLGGEPDVWHIHNHSLAKNVFLPAALKILADEGAAQLLQIHDFAEDRRPANYVAQRGVLPGDALAANLYPQAPHVHYAALTSRDLGHLAALGMADERRHLLANPVVGSPFQSGGQHNAEAPTILYPTRAIRRKNLGELLLLALLDGGAHRYATTLRPENPQWQTIHAQWESLAAELRLPVDFALGEDPNADFEALVASAAAIATTSVAEGFGLAFLEPALWHKPLIGRNLPDITADFAAVGWRSDGLYDALAIPLEWLDAATLRAHYNELLAAAYAAYDRELTPGGALAAWQALTRGGVVDFGRLPESMQAGVLRALASDEPKRDALPSPAGLMVGANGLEAQAQAKVVSEHFNPTAYGARLKMLYETVAASPRAATAPGNAAALLDAFLDPRRANALLS